MENTRTALRRRNSRDPLPGRERIIKKPSARDRRVFQKLHPLLGHKFLPTNHLIQLLLPDATKPQRIKFTQRLGHLFENPNCYLYRPHQQLASPNTNYKHTVHALDTNGEKVLKEDAALHIPAHRLNSAPYPHDLIGSIVEADIEFGVSKDPALRLRAWKDLCTGEPFWKSASIPQATLSSQQPFRIQLTDSVLYLDGKPFTLESERKFLAIPGMEVDRDTEPGRPDKHHRVSIEQKLVKLREFFGRRLYQHHYGFPNAVVPFITTNEARLREIMGICMEVIGPCTYLLFKVVPDYAYEPHFRDLTGDLLTAPWLRLGHKPFSLAKLGEVD